ncbi:RNA polymerase sigma-70 factor, ECF subfamily [Hydrobacter penzbergensis]|uniref:RNA polymerase sigma-70 factor, ECF subfamily n=1 Tax=Hydrobacter penzbergensis TaxID=1235997 RepID=A0A8X8IDM6_9BACT|nr:sigma-70 family RNA polymerase sigma factor [Hydrobacter penzbergensis]SDW39347.1 RNA polymerase sigma-70 factor, ECF subfamily [Hydrobacter penzbergensis]
MSDSDNPANTIKEWVTRYTDDLYSWAFYKTDNKETAEDLVQETFLAACQSLLSFKGIDARTWLLGILNHKIADHYRQQYKRAAVTEQVEQERAGNALMESFFDEEGSWVKKERPQQWGDEQGHLLDDMDFTKVLRQCMHKLPATWLAAVQLKYLEEKKGELICQELQIAPTNFWQILHRAKLQLRKCLEHNWFKRGE